MIILFSGTRYAHNEHHSTVEQTIDDCITKNAKVGEKITVVVGDARGLDAIVRDIAHKRNFELHVFKADWDQHGKAAGPRRNAAMVKFWADSDDDNKAFLAFPSATQASRGTNNTINLVLKSSKAATAHTGIVTL